MHSSMNPPRAHYIFDLGLATLFVAILVRCVAGPYVPNDPEHLVGYVDVGDPRSEPLIEVLRVLVHPGLALLLPANTGLLSN